MTGEAKGNKGNQIQGEWLLGEQTTASSNARWTTLTSAGLWLGQRGMPAHFSPSLSSFGGLPRTFLCPLQCPWIHPARKGEASTELEMPLKGEVCIDIAHHLHLQKLSKKHRNLKEHRGGSSLDFSLQPAPGKKMQGLNKLLASVYWFSLIPLAVIKGGYWQQVAGNKLIMGPADQECERPAGPGFPLSDRF